MFVFDTSAFINGWNDHYPPPTFTRVWEYLETQMDQGIVIAPRAVLVEIERRTDALTKWAKPQTFTDPSPEVQRRVGELQASHSDVFGRPGRNEADPWVIALAEEREWTVVTYEGRQFSGAERRATPRNPRMPDICAELGVRCINPAPALEQLGLRL